MLSVDRKVIIQAIPASCCTNIQSANEEKHVPAHVCACGARVPACLRACVQASMAVCFVCLHYLFLLSCFFFMPQ